MGRGLAALALVIGAAVLCAQASAADDRLSDAQRLGRRLFEQSCAISHTKPTLASDLYAPARSRETLGGRTEVIREVSTNGTSRMAGFRYDFPSNATATIVAYPQPLAAADAN